MALKALSKKHVVQTKQTKSVINERDAMQELRGFGGVVTLFGSFQDHDSLYFAMEIVSGGELWSALYNVPSPLPQGDVGGISAKAAMFYTGSVACALDHIHGCGVAAPPHHARRRPSHTLPPTSRIAPPQGSHIGTSSPRTCWWRRPATCALSTLALPRRSRRSHAPSPFVARPNTWPPNSC